MDHLSVEEFRKLGTQLRTSKYGNKKTFYAGRLYDSKKEAKYAKELDAKVRAVEPCDRVVLCEYQVRYSIDINAIHVCDYFSDFRVTYADGRVEVVDVKGLRTPVYKIKKKLVKAIHGVDIIEI